MKQITSITAEPKQRFSVRLDDGTMLSLQMEYSDINRCWFIDVEYQGYTSTCHQITNNPNILRQVRNMFDFGIACYVADGFEPWFIDDFVKGRAVLYILDKAEVEYLEKNIYGKVL